jgi:hypothetical protein
MNKSGHCLKRRRNSLPKYDDDDQRMQQFYKRKKYIDERELQYRPDEIQNTLIEKHKDYDLEKYLMAKDE